MSVELLSVICSVCFFAISWLVIRPINTKINEVTGAMDRLRVTIEKQSDDYTEMRVYLAKLEARIELAHSRIDDLEK